MGTVMKHELNNMTLIGKLMATAELERRESRGSHAASCRPSSNELFTPADRCRERAARQLNFLSDLVNGKRPFVQLGFEHRSVRSSRRRRDCSINVCRFAPRATANSKNASA